jgi:hypothetical protein
MMKVSYLVTPLLARLIEFGIWLVVLLRRFMMWNLMKPNSSQEEDENLDDVRALNFQMQ